MTRVIIYQFENYISGFEISGHSGYSDEGSDIVCSAVSTASQMAVTGIKEVLKKNAFIEISSGYLKLKLDKNDMGDEKVQFMLETMKKTIKEISKEYSKFVKMEVKKDVY